MTHITIRIVFAQALTELDLGNNQIGDEGVIHLEHALENNKVTRIPYSRLSS